MPANDDAATPQENASSPGKALMVLDAAVRPDAGAPDSGGSNGARDLRRIILPAVLVLMTGAVGWYAGASAGMGRSGEQGAAVESALVAELKAQANTIAALEARLKTLEAAPQVEAVVKPAIEILARRIDEIARTQTAALTNTSSRLDRSDRDIGARLDRVNERIERVEKQVSSPVPVSSTQKNTTVASRSTPEEKAREPEASPIHSYVLRDVFRGGALVESRHGLMEVFPGVQLPGAGRVRSVEKRDGRWVVVTTTGVIEGR